MPVDPGSGEAHTETVRAGRGWNEPGMLGGAGDRAANRVPGVAPPPAFLEAGPSHEL